MGPKEAIGAAKTYFAELFAEAPTLEEVWFDDMDHVWCVTLGRAQTMSIGMLSPRLFKDYKVVRINDTTGKLISIKNRDGERAP